MKVLLFILLVSAVFGMQVIQESQGKGRDSDLDKWVGSYDISDQCDSWYCERTYFDEYENNFCCPEAGNSGVIRYDENKQLYYIEFRTYNMFWSSEFFFATFDTDNKKDSKRGTEVRILLSDGYVMNIVPCYHGQESERVCNPTSDYPQLAIYKTQPNKGTDLEWCSFTFTKIL